MSSLFHPARQRRRRRPDPLPAARCVLRAACSFTPTPTPTPSAPSLAQPGRTALSPFMSERAYHDTARFGACLVSPSLPPREREREREPWARAGPRARCQFTACCGYIKTIVTPA